MEKKRLLNYLRRRSLLKGEKEQRRSLTKGEGKKTEEGGKTVLKDVAGKSIYVELLAQGKKTTRSRRRKLLPTPAHGGVKKGRKELGLRGSASWKKARNRAASSSKRQTVATLEGKREGRKIDLFVPFTSPKHEEGKP